MRRRAPQSFCLPESAPNRLCWRHSSNCCTPFGARFFGLLAQEYESFEQCSSFLLDNQEKITPGALRGFTERLKVAEGFIPQAWHAHWEKFTEASFWLQATDDVRSDGPDSSTTPVPGPPLVLGRLEFQPVTLFDGTAPSYTLSGQPHWYMRTITLMEGRAVVESMMWIMDSLGPEHGPRLAEAYLQANYGNALYDYRFLPDVAANLCGAPTVADAFRQYGRRFATPLWLVDHAAWYALHAGMRKGEQGSPPFRLDTMFFRFFFAVDAFVRDARLDVTPEKTLLDAAHTDLARDAGIVPMADTLTTTLTFVEAVEKRVADISNDEMRNHLLDKLYLIRENLKRRIDAGYAFPAAAPNHGNCLAELDKETSQALFYTRQPGQWVADWFEFRTKCLFTPTLATLTLRHLRRQFGLSTVLVNCDCGALVSYVAPLRRRGYRFSCPGCGRAHDLESSEMTMIRVD